MWSQRVLGCILCPGPHYITCNALSEKVEKCVDRRVVVISWYYFIPSGVMGDRRTWNFLDYVGSLNGNTPLGKLLVQTSRRLPPELRENTMAILQQSVVDKRRNISLTDAQYEPIRNSGNVLFAQLATVEYLTLPMLKRTPSGQPSFDLQPLRSPVSLQGWSTTKDVPVKSLWVRISNIFGRGYISEIGVDQSGDDVLSVPVSSRQVAGMRFALGRFGLRALRVLYDDGSKSAWLGDTSGSWFGNIRGTQLRNLHVTADVRPPHHKQTDNPIIFP